MRRLFSTAPYATVWVIGFFQETAFFLLVNLPGRLQQLGVGEAGIGVAYSVSALAALLLRPWFGRLLDVIHRRTVLRAAGILNVAATLALSLVDETGIALWLPFLAQRVLQIVLFTALLAYAADSLPPELRTQGLAVFGLSGLIPITVANLAGDALISFADYPGLLVAAAASGTISWVLVWRLPLLPLLGSRPRRSFWAVVAQRDLLPLWWITFMFSIGMEVMFTFMRTYINARPVTTLGGFFAVYGSIAIATRLIGGRRYDRLPHRLVTVVAISTQAAGLGLVAIAHSTGILLVGAALLGAAHGVVFPILSSQVVSRARGSERGSAIAMFTSIFDIALLTIAPIVGLVIDRAGYGPAFGGVAITLGLGTAVFVVLDRHATE